MLFADRFSEPVKGLFFLILSSPFVVLDPVFFLVRNHVR